MSTLADTSIAVSIAPRAGLAARIDRWIYVFMAGLFVATALVGFVPSSIGKVMAVQAGARPPFPIVLHVHAALMGSWLMLLLVQTSLAATGRQAMHRTLGLLSLVLVPAMVVTGLALVPTMYGMLWAAVQAPPPGLADALRHGLHDFTNIVLAQLRIGVLFPILICVAVLARKRDAGLHKRMMILATAALMAAATDRIAWLPTTLPNLPLTIELYPLLLVVPMFAWDLARLRRVHAAYWIWIGLNLPLAIAMFALWNSPWWQAAVPHLLGVA